MGAGDRKKGQEGLSATARGMRQAQPYIDAVWRLLGGSLLGVAGGYFADRALGTDPWFLLGLSMLGLGVGFFAFLRSLLRLGKK